MLGSLKGQARGAATNAAGQALNDPSRRKFIFYCIISLFAGAVAGLTAFISRTEPQQAYLACILCLLAFGCLHVWAMYGMFPWAGKNSFSNEFWFTVLIAFLMFIGFCICFFILNRGYVLIFSSAMLVFMLPMIVHWSFIYAAMIPPKDYKKWLYPDKPIIADMENIDLSNFAVITFIFSKKEGEQVKSNFQSKAPYPIRLGDLFYFFIQEWNRKNPGSTIQYLDQANKSFGWYFYVKKTWWKPKRYLDADFSVKENKIGVNEIIETERIIL